ncbi:hypothetical protein [Peribacillus huizhouensis]|uniref:Uncharacterized protein n=1 Tax=Peribacillus huizhouensis TaxID=1501239 RepID=A0ABR6CMP7_9BACI|nr:hypothetical protein [Peribacillus huizhouensis]MBA9026270.1 hypothetical protein [Peribacillus huizhouensis]
MISSDNREIIEMLETLLIQEMERRLKPPNSDEAVHNKEQTVININYDPLLYALFYLLLGEKNNVMKYSILTTENKDTNIQSAEKRVKKMVHQITTLKGNNRLFYSDILEMLS